MKKILLSIDSAGTIGVVCDCTGMHTVEDAKKCAKLAAAVDDVTLTEIATLLIEEDEYTDYEDLTLKVIDISTIENPLK